MTLDETKIKDWRSTGRRKLRRALYRAYVTYRCFNCKVTTKEPPSDAPAWFDEIWPRVNRVLDYPLQANHKSKDLTENDEENGEWLCAPCHKEKDSKTGKGISTVQRRQ